MQALEENPIFLSHQRAILYFDTDLLSLLPDVGDQPAALRWEDKVLACNKAARHYGVADNMLFKKAVQMCPGLITLGAEHIPPLADLVNKVNRVLRDVSPMLERVNLDECYLDVTSNPLLGSTRTTNPRSIPRDPSCPCGCIPLLSAARQLGEQTQANLVTSLHVRCTAGASSSKLLARLASLRASHGQCRVIVPDEVRELLVCQHVGHVLPNKISSLLKMRGIHTTADIRKMSLNDLQRIVSLDDAVTAVNAACGVDVSPVVTSDLWRLFCVEVEVREKFCALLLRLCALAEEDGRTPVALKVSVRKFDPVRRTCSKESKTVPCNLNCGKTDVMSRLMNMIIASFRRLIDLTRPFQLTLLGLSFTRFQDSGTSAQLNRSVASCLLRKRELSVEAPVNISYEGSGCRVTDSTGCSEQRDVDVDESQCEKKAKLDIFIKSKKFHDDTMDVCSPSKLKVGDLSLGDDASSARGFMHW